MTATTLAATILSTLVTLLPPDRTAALHGRQYPLGAETSEQRQQRYASIAQDVANVAVAQAALGQGDALQGAALLVAVAMRESRLDPDVDAQRCSEERIRLPGPNCDGGRSGTLWQLRPAPETRQDAARKALRGMRGSMRRCGHLGGWFLGKGCADVRGQELSRDRLKLAADVERRMRNALRTSKPDA